MQSPLGATDTPTGQIDSERCVDGCRLCVDACPSHAIYLVFDRYPEPAPKDHGVSRALLDLCGSKTVFEAAAESLSENQALPAGGRRPARTLRRSARILAEDCAREAGYMIPLCEMSRMLLEEIDCDK